MFHLQDNKRNNLPVYYDGLLLLGKVSNEDTPQHDRLVEALEEARSTRIKRIDSLSAQVIQLLFFHPTLKW